jgi:hypothetical protein|tara:strand:+ start:269 stop:1714 length:1446 start_codon:yes stop_codon:yes gene_type:complete
MKPWFVKEADIIKFPEPEKKVIELPNVQSYPDFLTGVKDLYMRKEKGEISQASHDKLYTDLIHRFMKKENVETPWFLQEGVLDDIKKIANYVKLNGTEILQKIGNWFKGQKQNVQENAGIADMALLQQIQKRNPGILAQFLQQQKAEDKKPILQSIQKLVQTYGENIKVFFRHLTTDEIMDVYKHRDIAGAVNFLQSGPLDESVFDKSKAQQINILQELASKNKQFTQILLQENLLLNLAKDKEVGGRGEGFVQLLFAGSGTGGKAGAAGDVKFSSGEYEVKTNGRKSSGAMSPIVFAGRARDMKPKLIQAGTFVKDFMTKKGLKDHVKPDGQIRADRVKTGKSYNSYKTKGMIDFVNSLNKADATEFLMKPVELIFGQVPEKAKELIQKSVSLKAYNPDEFMKGFLIANAFHYMSTKKFDGVIFLNLHSNDIKNILMKTFDKDSIISEIENGNITKIRTESINGWLSGDSQEGLPGLMAK